MKRVDVAAFTRRDGLGLNLAWAVAPGAGGSRSSAPFGGPRPADRRRRRERRESRPTDPVDTATWVPGPDRSPRTGGLPAARSAVHDPVTRRIGFRFHTDTLYAEYPRHA